MRNDILEKYFKIDGKVYPTVDRWKYKQTGYENGCYHFKCGRMVWWKNGYIIAKTDSPSYIRMIIRDGGYN